MIFKRSEMDFGRVPLEQLERIEFSLPEIKSTSEEKVETNLWIGCPIWSNDKFKGTLYPADAKKSDFLIHYAQQFNSIELNSTYYALPSDDTIKNWVKEASEVNPLFKFCPKVLKAISHEGSLDLKYDLLPQYLHTLEMFGDQLGLSFLQLPPHFSPVHFSQLVGFLDMWPKDFRLAVELRHAGWFKGRDINATLINLFHKRNVSIVITDTPGRQDLVHQVLTSDQVMIRFVCNGLHPVDSLRMNHWARRLPDYSQHGVKEIYFFVHEEQEPVYIKIFNEMIPKLQSRYPVKNPTDHSESSESQLSLF